MKIFLPFKLRDIGGPSSFALKFKQGMEFLGHKVIFDYEPDYDVLFLIVQCPFKYLFDAKRQGKKIIQRLDGCYYWSANGWKFPFLNAKAMIIRHFFTDFTVYQSQYSKLSCDRFLVKKRNDKHAIVYNGVDVKLFSPQGQKKNLRDNKDQKIFFTASAFRRRDQILPILEAVDNYKRRYNSNFKLVVAGSFERELKGFESKLTEHSNVEYIGKIANKDLPVYERAADVFLFTHLNPPCPNNVIEALACGLPICGVADGAMPEIVTNRKNGELLNATSNGFWRKRPIDINAFANNLYKTIANQNFYSRQSTDTAKKRFSLEKMCGEYSKIFKLLIK